MSVYVDPMMACNRTAQWKWGEACHLTADSPYELHAMANRLGLKREWAQMDRPSFPHYDLTREVRELAVACGAIELTRNQAVAKYRAWRGFEEENRRLRLLCAAAGLCPDCGQELVPVAPRGMKCGCGTRAYVGMPVIAKLRGMLPA